jgi:hypothetical protein
MSPNPTNPTNVSDAITKTCPICWETFTATGRQAHHKIYCTPACKRTAAARREVERSVHPGQPQPQTQRPQQHRRLLHLRP